MKFFAAYGGMAREVVDANKAVEEHRLNQKKNQEPTNVFVKNFDDMINMK